MSKVLITGVNGFVGKHLAQYLTEAGCEIAGVGREAIATPKLKQFLRHYSVCDLADSRAVSRLDLQPFDAVISLAGLANVGQSFEQPELYKQVNVAVLANLCQRLVEQDLSPRVIAISSGAVYDSHQPMPLSESSRLAKSSSPYVESKVAMEKAALEFRSNGLPECVIVRPFNHFGPGQGPGFLLPDLYEKMLEAIKNHSPLKVGNLSTHRDYTDVRDVVQAYAALALADFSDLKDPVYNVCSGTSHSGEELVAELKKLIPGADTLELAKDPALIRADDPEELVGSNERLRQATGWQPQIAFEQTIADFVASKQA